MEGVQFLSSTAVTKKQWLQYYINTWNRNLIARTIDVHTDMVLKSVDPEQQVQSDAGAMVPVKVRLEHRKIAVQDALEIVKAAAALLELSDEDLEKEWSPEALAIAKDMLPAEPVEGAECELDNASGKGTYQNMDGKLVCVAKPEASNITAPVKAPTADEEPDASAKV